MKHGLSAILLDELGRRPSASSTRRWRRPTAGFREHVLARAELKVLVDEVTLLVEMLDGINRYRFGQGSRAAGGVAVGEARGVGAAGGAVEEPGSGTAPPAEGEVKPAA